MSQLPPGGRWWNQAFLVSWQGAYTVKNILGTVPVRKDGSAYFEAPPGKALYFQALDAEGRCVRSMRTFVQAVPGVTRSCIGCHEHKYTAPPRRRTRPLAAAGRPDTLREESWGSGYLDYPTQVQPILDLRCVDCHGGEKGIAGGLDLSGGWTWAFSISYETLIKNTLTGFLNCNNGSVHTSRILPPRKHGSGAAPLAELLIGGHEGRIKGLTRAERDTVLAWMDTNCNYHGTWNWTEHATCDEILEAGKDLARQMERADCTRCHAATVGNDWVNLRRPEMSRILRAPLLQEARSSNRALTSAPLKRAIIGRRLLRTPLLHDGFGLPLCRDRKARKVLPLVTKREQPPDVHRPRRTAPADPKGETVVTFASTDDERYREVLTTIRRARGRALAKPRVDMPGARMNPGECRVLVPVPLPDEIPPLEAKATSDGVVHLAWRGSSRLIGLEFDLYRDWVPDFACTEGTRIGGTTFFRFDDHDCPPGEHHYAMVAASNGRRLGPVRAKVTVPEPEPPGAPAGLAAVARAEAVELSWEPPAGSERPGQTRLAYNVYREKREEVDFDLLTPEPVGSATYVDRSAPVGVESTYVVTAVGRHGVEGPPSGRASAAALPAPREPVLAASFDGSADAVDAEGRTVKARLRGKARVVDGTLDLREGGSVTYPGSADFALDRRLTVEFRVHFEELTKMPVVVACGSFGKDGWFVQALQGRWRWHLAGVSCDGGKVERGRWVHVACTFDGGRVASGSSPEATRRGEARLYLDGKLARKVPCDPHPARYRGPLHVGQYVKQEEQFQVLGRITGLRILNRVLAPDEIAASAGPGGPR